MTKPENRKDLVDMDILLTVDMEQDCPPYMDTFRGIEQGTGKLLSLFSTHGIKTTFFFTGMVAHKFPRTVEEVSRAGHEIGCHGQTHTPFTNLNPAQAKKEIETSAFLLRQYDEVLSFRAPNLVFPEAYTFLLAKNKFRIDSSLAKYKLSYLSRTRNPPLKRLPVSATSSVLRLPPWIRTPYLSALASPVVLFVHPWEFVDLRDTDLRRDCRFKTGDIALNCLSEVITFFQRKKARFRCMKDLL